MISHCSQVASLASEETDQMILDRIDILDLVNNDVRKAFLYLREDDPILAK